MNNLQIEAEYCQELWGYCEIGINDTRTDGDRLIANMVAGLIADKIVNEIRFKHHLKEALDKLSEDPDHES